MMLWSLQGFEDVPADFARLLDPAQRVIKAIVEC